MFKMICKKRCQMFGRINEVGDVLEVDEVTDVVLAQFNYAEAPKEASKEEPPEEPKIAGLTQEQYKLKLTEMNICFAPDATFEDLAQFYVEALNRPSVNPDVNPSDEGGDAPDPEGEGDESHEPAEMLSVEAYRLKLDELGVKYSEKAGQKKLHQIYVAATQANELLV